MPPARPFRPKVLALVLAGGEGGRLELLTDERPKPAMPFGGVYRLIDFVLSNCMHSGIDDVWVVQQYQPHALSEHLSSGRPWDLDRTYGGLRVLQPYLGHSESGWYEGNADAIYRNKAQIRGFGADLLLVLSADHVYKLDYGDVIGRHLESNADVTMVTARVRLEEAGRFGTVEVENGGRVVDFAYKPETPASGLVTTEVFVYDTRRLLETLEDIARDDAEKEQESSLEDFGDVLLPRLVAQGRAYEHRLESYWRDVGTIDAYWQAHMDLLAPESGLALDEPSWPILTSSAQRPPARIEKTARVDESLISPGCTVEGSVSRSVLAPGVVVEQGADVRGSVVLQDTVIRAEAALERAIVDVDAEVEERARVGAAHGDITLVGRRARVSPGSTVPAGARVRAAPD